MQAHAMQRVQQAGATRKSHASFALTSGFQYRSPKLSYGDPDGLGSIGIQQVAHFCRGSAKLQADDT
jgi:hypothetical protein